MLKYEQVISMNLFYNDKYYDINIIRKNNKNLYIRVSDDFKINITCPYLYTNKMIEKLVNDNINEITSMIDKKIKSLTNKFLIAKEKSSKFSSISKILILLPFITCAI